MEETICETLTQVERYCNKC